MSVREIEAGDVNHVVLSVAGDLTVVGWDRPTISFSTDDEDSHTVAGREASNRELSLRSGSDASLNLPRRLGIGIQNVNGDARIRGIEGEVNVDAVDGDLRLEDIGGAIRIDRCKGDIKVVRARGGAEIGRVAGDLHAEDLQGNLTCTHVDGDVKVERHIGDVVLSEMVNGDVSLRSIDGNSQVYRVSGDLAVRGCRGARIDHIGGDVAVQDARDDVAIDSVDGDATIDRCAGRVELATIGGDFTGKDLPGGVSAPQIGGRARLSTAFTSGREYQLTCGGSATILMAEAPTATSLQFELRRTDGGRIEVDGPVSASNDDSGVVRGQWGSGEATLRVQSGGNLRLLMGERGQASDNFVTGIFESIGEEIQSAFSAFTSTGGIELERQIRDKTDRAARHAEEAVRRVAERAERQAHDAARRAVEEAEKRAQRAGERAQRNGERAARMAERGPWHWSWRGQSGGGWVAQPPFPPPQPVAPSGPPRPSVNSEERLLILQMVAEGTISSAEAAKLLEVLGS